MKVLIVLVVLFLSVQCLLICSLFVQNLLKLYQLIGVSLLISYISWNLVDFIDRRLLPNKSIEPKGRSVLITGCDSGFGYGSALRLRAKGFRVFATVLSEDSDGAVSLRANAITTIELNVLDSKQISRAFDILVKDCEVNHSELWAVVNNAGVYACGELEWGRIDDLETLVKINIFGYIQVIRTFLPLIRRSRGRIVNVSSVAALFSAPGTTIYSMSKCAVSSVTDGLRRELYNKGVDVIEIQPQAYKNSMTNRIVEGLDESWKRTDDRVKNDFGDEYYLSFRSYISRNIDSCRDKAYEVVDAITDSVSLKRVRYKYLCCGLIDRLILWSFHWLPLECLEPIVSLFTVRSKPSWTLQSHC